MSKLSNLFSAGKIHISGELNGLLRMLGGFVTETRGEVIIKGKGVMETYWLLSRVDNIIRTTHMETHPDQIFFEGTTTHRTSSLNSMYREFVDNKYNDDDF